MNYSVGEKINIERPVNRILYICQAVKGKRVLDLGCWDETALVKVNTKYWLHNELLKQASYIIGIDNSLSLPSEGIIFDNSEIIKGDCTNEQVLEGFNIDIIVAGELIEHLPNVMEFLFTLKKIYPGKELILTTPNATSLSNILLGLIKRESMHIDHLNIYSYKTLFSLCRRSGFQCYEILPYHVRYTEMILKNKGIKRWAAIIMEKLVNAFEFLFPLLSGGYIVTIKI